MSIQVGEDRVKVNLADISQNSKSVQRGIKEWDQANDAELIESLERRGAVKSLSARSFARPSIVVDQRQHDEDEGFGFKRGDLVTMTDAGMFNAALSGDVTDGRVEGIRDGFIKVNGRYYAPNLWQREIESRTIAPYRR